MERVARQGGMLGRAASEVTLSAGRKTTADKQKDEHQKLQFCSAEYICFSSHEEPETEALWLQQQEALLCLCFLSRCLLSSAVRVTELWAYFWELCSVINIPFNLRGESTLLTSSDLFVSLSGQ